MEKIVSRIVPISDVNAEVDLEAPFSQKIPVRPLMSFLRETDQPLIPLMSILRSWNRDARLTLASSDPSTRFSYQAH
jgi:hypothetical protein